jgi:glycosyltransferase involved in cell wall biosynthesis
MKKIHVAFCLRDMQLGGVESVLIRTLDELKKHKNINISVITYVNIHENIYKKYFEQNKNIKLYSLYPCSWLGTKLPHFFLWRIFIHLLRDIYRNVKRLFVSRKLKNIDVFIDYHDFGFANELKHIKGAKKIAWFHSSLKVFIERGFYKNFEHYDNVVVLTDECANDLKKMYPQFVDKIVRIYNPIDIKSIKEKANGKNKIKGKYFCSVARLTPDKDIKTLLKGFDLFWQSNKKPDVKLVIVGDGNKAEEYKKYANDLKSNKQIMFVGAQKNPFAYMNGALANVLSSYAEGFGLVLVENAIVGTINISSNCKYGPREILLDGRGGLLFEPGKAEQLAKCMSDVYNGKVNIKKMVQESTKALNRFDSKTIIKEIISLIS